MKLFNIFAVIAGTMVASSQAISISALDDGLTLDGAVTTGDGTTTATDAQEAADQAAALAKIPGVVAAIFEIGDADKSGIIDKDEL